MIASNSIKWLLDDCCLYKATASGKLQLNIAELAGNLAYHAMMLEAHLTPKPGLVDCLSTGAHTDMDINTFIASADALRPFMKKFVRTGYNKHELKSAELLPHLRRVGIEAEKAMFLATGNVNTHKGMIFTLGLICGAVGWLYRKNLDYDALHIRSVIKDCCASLVVDDLKESIKPPATAGERLFLEHGLTGIRGEAALGYPTIFRYGLPVYEASVSEQKSEEQAMLKTLFALMVNNCDTNLVNRGGLQGLEFVQEQSRSLLSVFENSDSDNEQSIGKLDKELTRRNLSPGGSADLLAATWLLAQLNICANDNQQLLTG